MVAGNYAQMHERLLQRETNGWVPVTIVCCQMRQISGAMVVQVVARARD